MKSRPASSASLARARQSSQLADQRSGTLVAERPEEQLAPNRPIFRALPLYMAILFFMDALGASTAGPPFLRVATNSTGNHSLRCGRKFNRIQTSVVALNR